MPRASSLPRAPSGADVIARLDPALIRLALVLMLGGFASGLDMTIVNVALNTIGRDFDATVSTLQWVSTAYLLTVAVVVPLTAWASDRYGARRMWFVSLGVFVLGSTLCGAAWSIQSLIAFRIVQGIGGGMLLPLIRTILAQAAGRDRMGRVMVFVAIPSSLTPAIGPVLGGLVVDSLTWRWAFYINIPICLFALLGAWLIVPRNKPVNATQPLDRRGLALLTIGLGTIVYGLSQLGHHPEAVDQPTTVSLVVGLIMLAAYVWHAVQPDRRAIIDLGLFTVRSFATSAMVLFLSGGSLFGALFLFPLFYQQVRGAEPLAAGLLMAPLGLGMALSMAFAGKIVDRTKAERTVMLTGIALAAIGMSPYAVFTGLPNDWLLAGANLCIGLGLGAVLIATFTATYRDLATEQIASATSASRIIQQLGSLLGIALLASIVQLYGGMSATAFAHAFAWTLGLMLITAVPAACNAPAAMSAKR